MNSDLAPHLIAQHKAAQQTSYQGIALTAVESNEPWLGFGAQLATDWLALQFALTNAEPTLSKDEVSEVLTGIWVLVEEELQGKIGNIGNEAIEASGLLETLRQIYSRKLEGPSWGYFTELVAPVSVFDNLIITKESFANHFGFTHFDEKSAEIIIQERVKDAKKLYAEYYALQEVATKQAFSALYQADLATYEAWLLDKSLAMEDETRLWASIQFALSSGYLQQLPGIPVNLDAYHKDVRGALVRSVGVVNSDSLLEALPIIMK